LPVYRTDLWFSDPRLRSTVGLPTPDNAEEALEFCFTLGLISKAKGSRTAQGQTAVALRRLSPADQNPFVLQLESAAFLSELIARDALALCELARQLGDYGETLRRDDLIPDGVLAVARRAHEAARALGM